MVLTRLIAFLKFKMHKEINVASQFDHTRHDALQQFDILAGQTRARIAAGEPFSVRTSDKGHVIVFGDLQREGVIESPGPEQEPKQE